MHKAAIIGVNGWAANYLPHLTRLTEAGKLEFAAAVVRNPAKNPEVTEKLRAQGVKIYPTQEEMYAEIRPDLVCIPTGIEFHEPMTLAALEHGCNVLLEKPAAASVAAVNRMIEAAKRHPECFAAVAFQHVYDRNIHHFKKSFEGPLGRPEKITVRGLWPRADQYYIRNDWAGKLRSSRGALVLDSPANNAFAHFINISLFLCGETFERTTSAVVRDAKLWRARPEIETFDSCQLCLRTETGTDLDIYLSHTSREKFDPQLKIECPGGMITWQQNSPWQITASSGKILESGPYGDPIAQMFNDIAEKLDSPDRFFCSLEIAKEHTKIIEALHRNYSVIPVPPEKTMRIPETGQQIFPLF